MRARARKQLLVAVSSHFVSSLVPSVHAVFMLERALTMELARIHFWGQVHSHASLAPLTLAAVVLIAVLRLVWCAGVEQGSEAPVQSLQHVSNSSTPHRHQCVPCVTSSSALACRVICRMSQFKELQKQVKVGPRLRLAAWSLLCVACRL